MSIEYKPFENVTLETRRPGKWAAINSTYDAAKFILEEWPVDPDINPNENLTIAKKILIKCLEGECSARVARVAFIEAAREPGYLFRPIPDRYQPESLLRVCTSACRLN